ncbi:unnamed protein product [Heterobilharzia americana]|nr:unnamed protein product [Heterobilharzia americana]
MASSGSLGPNTYSSLTCFIFLFNVIVGTGVLTLPAAFQHAGWLISVLVIVILCFLSFLTFTFVIEALSITNVLQRMKGVHTPPEEHGSGESIAGKMSSDVLRFRITANDFLITDKYELGQMSLIYFGNLGNILFYLNVCTYLYGDLAIYSTAVPKSLRNVVCSFNNSRNSSISDFDLCWASSSLTRLDVYRIFVVCFGAFVLPFLFFNVIRSRWLQLLTVCLRWIGFILMFSLSIERAIILHMQMKTSTFQLYSCVYWNPSIYTLSTQREPIPRPPAFQPHNIPSLFGVCVYVFMCHHSIPGIVTPVKNKHNILYRVFLPVFITVLLFNLLLSGTAVIAFNHIEDLYTLNFTPNKEFIDISQIPYTIALIFGYFLCLFPVFALTSSYPIIGTSLLGNIYSLCHYFPICQSDTVQRILKYTLPFIVLLPPLCIALITDDVGYLTGFTGAIFGSGIQYIIPAVLVYKARQQFTNFILSQNDIIVTIKGRQNHYDDNELTTTDNNDIVVPTSSYSNAALANSENNEIYSSTEHLTMEQSVSVIGKCSQHRLAAISMHASPFQHCFWIIMILIWALFCIVIVLIDKIHHV